MIKKVLILGLLFLSFVLVSCTEEEIEKPDIIYNRIAGGIGFSLVIDDKGDLYGMGTQIYGVLATGVTEDIDILTPTKLNDYFSLNPDETFVSVASGERNAFALTSLNRLFSWGWNIIGQTGTNLYDKVITTPTNITPLLNLSFNEQIAQIQTSKHHTILLTTKGRVFGWGLNTNGEIGSAEEDIILIRQKVALKPVELTKYFKLSNRDIIIRIGLHHAVSAQNKFFAWGPYGINKDGFQSTVINEMSKYLNFLNEDEKVVNLLANGSYLVTNQNRIFKTAPLNAFIDGKTQNAIAYQNLSFLMDDTGQYPKIVEQNGNIILIQPNRKVRGYGMNEFGVLGAGHDVRLTFFRITENRQDIEYVYEDIVWIINWNIGEVIRYVHLSFDHTLMITSDNRLFIWGSNANGELGDGTLESSYSPKEIHLY